jgi:hypothetical protein
MHALNWTSICCRNDVMYSREPLVAACGCYPQKRIPTPLASKLVGNLSFVQASMSIAPSAEYLLQEQL